MIRSFPIVDFIIGVVFYWYFFSGVIMQVLEWIASLRRWRSRGLYQGIRNMLGDEGLTDMFYQHPIIQGLYGGGGKSQNRLPSYIPANQFSSALLDMLAVADHELFLLTYQLLIIKKNVSKISNPSMKAHAEAELDRMLQLCGLSETSDFKKNEAFRNLLSTTIEKELKAFSGRFPDMESSVNEALNNYEITRTRVNAYYKELKISEDPKKPNSVITGLLILGVLSPKLAGVFSALFNGIPDLDRGDLASLNDRVRGNVEQWYNDAMDRLSGWYKRKSNISSFIIGIVIAIIFNIDSIEFSKYLWRDNSLQLALQSVAISETANQDGNFLERLIENHYYSIPVGWNFNGTVTSCGWITLSEDDMGIQIGSTCYRDSSMFGWSNGWYWITVKLLGLLISAFAGMQGASFWFDALQKITNIRLSGKKPIDNNNLAVG